MTTRISICALLAAMLMTAWLSGDEGTSELNGRWIVTSLVIDGTEVPVSKSSDKFWIEMDGNRWQYSFVIDDKRTAAIFNVTLAKQDTKFLVDAKLLNGAYAGQICKGICRIEGDVIQLCLADKPSMDRPDKFECPKDSGRQLLELKRE